MATKAERFKVEAQRASSTARKPKTRVRSTIKSVAAGLGTGARNLSRGRKATYAFEDSLEEKRPSRKSSRRSSNHQKAAPTLKAKQLIRLHSPTGRKVAAGKKG